MKKYLILTMLSLVFTNLFPATWKSFCPDTINANKICFEVGLDYTGVICSDAGMYIYNDTIEQWEYFTIGGYPFPVIEAANLSPYKILVIMGNGSYSDGIYTFDLQTKQFEEQFWCMNPKFIKYHELSETWFVGCIDNGMYQSGNGMQWSEVPYFANKSLVAMNSFDQYLVVKEISSINDIHWSDDSGLTWTEAIIHPDLSCLDFHSDGKLYGIFPGNSYSSGFYHSDDFGNTWEVEFWSTEMTATGHDAMNTIFVGWESNSSKYAGIAIYDPDAPSPGLSFLNDGLPNLNINHICQNPAMSALNIFCCTDAGVYYSIDYLTAINTADNPEPTITVFPNPVNDVLNVRVEKIDEHVGEYSLELINASGKQVFHDKKLIMQKQTKTIPCQYFETGIYYLRLSYGGTEEVRKIIIH